MQPLPLRAGCYSWPLLIAGTVVSDVRSNTPNGNEPRERLISRRYQKRRTVPSSPIDICKHPITNMQTPNYKLSRWVRSDQAKLEDLNADNAKIDGALAGLAQMAAELASTLASSAQLVKEVQIYETPGRQAGIQ